MDGDFIAGIIVVGITFAVVTSLVLVSRARIERFHREGARSLPPKILRDRRG